MALILQDLVSQPFGQETGSTEIQNEFEVRTLVKVRVVIHYAGQRWVLKCFELNYRWVKVKVN